MPDAEPLPESLSADDAFPEGWALGHESWQFHRRFFHRVRRCARYKEYTSLLWAIRRGDVEKLAPFRFRVRLADGTSIVVCGGRQRLSGVEAADWAPKPPKPPKPPRVWIVTPKPSKQAPAVAAAPAPEPPPPAPPPPAPERARPITASTLKLGSPAAAKALAERLRRMGVQAQLDGNIPATG